MGEPLSVWHFVSESAVCGSAGTEAEPDGAGHPVLQDQPRRGSMGLLSDQGPGIRSLHMRAPAFLDANRELPPPPTFGQGWAGLGL